MPVFASVYVSLHNHENGADKKCQGDYGKPWGWTEEGNYSACQCDDHSGGMKICQAIKELHRVLLLDRRYIGNTYVEVMAVKVPFHDNSYHRRERANNACDRP
jgi:hypothetical protein